MIIRATEKLVNNRPRINRVFLAGSIEMGKAENWQAEVEKTLWYKFDVYNPRRPDWDSSWGPESEKLEEQINWELNALEHCGHIIFYFDKNTLSPISLLELGFCTSLDANIYVICPKEFYRYTNVKVFCKKNNIEMYESLEDIYEILKYYGC